MRRSRTVTGSPDKVIQRECSVCQKPSLDDAFPRFQKDMPGKYVITEHERATCGQTECRGRNVSLVRVNPRQDYTGVRTRQDLLNRPPKGRTKKPLSTFCSVQGQSWRIVKQRFGSDVRESDVGMKKCIGGVGQSMTHPNFYSPIYNVKSADMAPGIFALSIPKSQQ